MTAAAACTSTETRIAGAARQRRLFRLFVMVVVFRIASPRCFRRSIRARCKLADDLPRKHGGCPYLAAEAYSFFVAPGKVDGYALTRTHRANELGRPDLIWAEAFPQTRCDRAQRFAQQERPGDDRIAREMPLCGGVIRREVALERRQRYPALAASRVTRSSSAIRGSLPVSLRGRDSTKQSGRGRKAASIRRRSAAMMASLVSPGATT